jgi:hypothetical protein
MPIKIATLPMGFKIANMAVANVVSAAVFTKALSAEVLHRRVNEALVVVTILQVPPGRCPGQQDRNETQTR